MWLYNVVKIVVMSGEVACCSVVCGTLVGVSVFSIMCSELHGEGVLARFSVLK